MQPISSTTPSVPHSSFWSKIPHVCSKVIDFATKYFLIVSSACLTVLGIKQIISAVLQTHPDKTKALKVAQGALFVGSGVAGCLAATTHLGWLDLRQFGPICEILGNGFFLLGNILALITQVELFKRADAINDETAKRSAIMGMINAIAYLMVPVVTMMGLPFALTLFFGCIGIFTGCLKILYDYFFLKSDAK